MNRSSFNSFFPSATGHPPYDYQRRLACGEPNGRAEAEWLASGATCQSQLINIPTGLDKTAAVIHPPLDDNSIFNGAAPKTGAELVVQ